jgi:hypothetical protein
MKSFIFSPNKAELRVSSAILSNLAATWVLAALTTSQTMIVCLMTLGISLRASLTAIFIEQRLEDYD